MFAALCGTIAFDLYALCNSRSAHAPTADRYFDAAHENIFASLSHLCARAVLDLFAAALAELLECSACVPLAAENVRRQAGGWRYLPSMWLNSAPCESWLQAAPALSGRILPRNCSLSGMKSSFWTISMIFTIPQIKHANIAGFAQDVTVRHVDLRESDSVRSCRWPRKSRTRSCTCSPPVLAFGPPFDHPRLYYDTNVIRDIASPRRQDG